MATKSYEGIRLQQIVQADGRHFKPEGGVYTPVTKEHEQLCAYYLSIGKLVEYKAPTVQAAPIAEVE